MVFQPEAQFQQFLHCKFRENIVRMLHIPGLEKTSVFMAVNKYGKVGLYHTEKFILMHTYVLDLSVPMQPQFQETLALSKMKKRNAELPEPKCQRTHLVVDACFAKDLKSVVFITTKSILQWYDIGEIETQGIGLELFPRKKFLNLTSGESPVPLKNKGHVETHRVFGLREAPTCMGYYGISSQYKGESLCPDSKMSKLLIGDAEGCITVILIDNTRKPLGFRKIRGVLHEIRAMDLVSLGLLMVYKAHNDAVNEIQFSSKRQLILSCSRDKKFSLFLKDFTETADPYIISLPKGVNCFSHSETMKIIATGSDDHLIRIFNQFVVKMPQMELSGHRAPVIGITFISVPFSEDSLLISLSEDVELRAWNPVNFVCLQSIYISFPINSTIQCKTPEFANKCLFVFQPHFEDEVKITGKQTKSSPTPVPPSKLNKESDGEIIILYCNSYARLNIEKETSSWPFDFEDFISEFHEATSTFEKKILHREQSVSRNPALMKLSDEEIERIEKGLDETAKEVMKIKRSVDKQLGLEGEGPGLSIQISNKMKSMSRRSGSAILSQKDFVRQGAVFRSFPIYEIPPMEFLYHGEMPVTDLMREAGVHKVTSVQDILTSNAKRCFSQENLNRKRVQDSFFKETSPLTEPIVISNSEESESSHNSDSSIANTNDMSESDYEEFIETSLQKLTDFQPANSGCD